MTKGDAASWKENSWYAKLMKLIRQTRIVPSGLTKKSEMQSKKSFEPFNGPGDALEEMKSLRMASNGRVRVRVYNLIRTSCISGNHGFVLGDAPDSPTEAGNDL